MTAGNLSPAALAVVLLLVVAPAVVVIGRFVLHCLRALAATPDAELVHFTRQGWLVLIVFLIPIGGVLFLCSGRLR